MRICQDKRKELSCRHVHRSWKEITPKSPPLFVDVGIGTGSKRRKPPGILDRRSPALTRRNRLPQRTRTCVCWTVDNSSHGRSSTAESEPEERGSVISYCPASDVPGRRRAAVLTNLPLFGGFGEPCTGGRRDLRHCLATRCLGLVTNAMAVRIPVGSVGSAHAY